MSGNTGRNDPCGGGSGSSTQDCGGAPRSEVGKETKDLRVFELIPRLANEPS
jgi:hypothetical protein